MEKGKLKFIRHGSSKDIYRVDKETIAFRFNNFFSVFDVQGLQKRREKK